MSWMDVLPWLAGLAGLVFARWGSRIDEDEVARSEAWLAARVESLCKRGGDL